MKARRRGRHGLLVNLAGDYRSTCVFHRRADGSIGVLTRSGFRNDAMGMAKHYRSRGFVVWLEVDGVPARRPGVRATRLARWSGPERPA